MSLLRSGAYTLMASLVQVVCGVITVAVVARTLGPAGKGAYDVYWTTANMAVMVLGLSLPAGVTYTVARGSADVRTLLPRLIAFALAITLVTILVLHLIELSAEARAVLPRDRLVLLMTGVAAGAIAGMNLFRAVIVGQREFKRVSIVDMARATTITAAIAAAAILAEHNGGVRIHWLVVANCAGVLAGATYYLLASSKTKSRDTVEATSSAVSEALRYAAPAYLANVVQYLNYRVDVYLVNGFSGTAAVGTYQVAVMIAETLRVLPTATQAVIWPTIAARQHLATENALLTKRTARLVFLITAAGAALVAVAATFALVPIFGGGFRSSLSALFALLPGITLFAITTVLAGYIAGMGGPRLNLYASALGLLVTLALDVLLIPRFGILGAAIASTFSYAITTLVTVIIFVRISGTSARDLFWPTAADFALIRNVVNEFVGRVLTRRSVG
jgi:O-antigen/teichoic acid export membrane protein